MPKHNHILHSLAVEKVPLMVRMMVQQTVLAHVVAVNDIALIDIPVHIDRPKVADGQRPVVVWALCHSPVSVVSVMVSS